MIWMRDFEENIMRKWGLSQQLKKYKTMLGEAERIRFRSAYDRVMVFDLNMENAELELNKLAHYQRELFIRTKNFPNKIKKFGKDDWRPYREMWDQIPRECEQKSQEQIARGGKLEHLGELQEMHGKILLDLILKAKRNKSDSFVKWTEILTGDIILYFIY